MARELSEDAAATVQQMKRIGAQRVDDARTCEYNAFYWCRVTLADEFIPQFEVVDRRLVDPDGYLDLLFWGRSDPMASVRSCTRVGTQVRQPMRDGGSRCGDGLICL